MSNVYRIHGARFLRKYTAAEKSSNYAYMADVRKIADTLCKVPWTRVSGDVAATTTIHTEEGLDWNEPERDRFDAAEWCGEHADGFHRAFAQAACYVFKMPTSAIGTAIQKIRVNVTSDPYNPYGARIAAMTSATLEIPMDCQTVREGEVFRAPDENGMGAAPRLYRTNADGTQTWYANSEIVELVPGTTLAAKQYLFVFVCLENYNRGRDGWIEGSSYIDNDVEITLASACTDLVADELNDLSAVIAPVEINVAKGKVYPKATGSISGIKGAVVMRNGDDLVLGNSVETIVGGGFLKYLNGTCTSAANSFTGDGMTKVINAKLDIYGRMHNGANDFSQFGSVMLAYTEDVVSMPSGSNPGGVTKLLAGIRWSNVLRGNGFTQFVIPSGDKGTELAAACASMGVKYAFVHGINGTASSYITVHIFPGNGYEYIFDERINRDFIANSLYPPAEPTKVAVSSVPVCNAWHSAVYLENGLLKCEEFPNDIAITGEVTSVRRMYDVANGKVNDKLKFVISGNLTLVGGVVCRNCAFVEISNGSVVVTAPPFDEDVTPDSFGLFSISPKQPKVVSDDGTVIPASGFIVTGDFTSIGGETARGFAEIDGSGNLSGGMLSYGSEYIASVSGAVYVETIGMIFSGSKFALTKCLLYSDYQEVSNVANSCIGLRELYERLYNGKLIDVGSESSVRTGAGFVIESTTKSVKVLEELGGGGAELVDESIPVFRMSLASMVVPFSVPTVNRARRMKLNWSNVVATGGKFNVWLKRNAWVSDLPNDVLNNPRIYDASANDVGGWELVGTIDASGGTTSETFDLSSPLDGYVASVLITAFVNLDLLNPSNAMIMPQGVATGFSVDTIDRTVTGLGGLWKPDITLIV